MSHTAVALLLIVSAALSGVGDIFILQWAHLKAPAWLGLGALLWLGALVLMGLALRASVLPFSVLIILWIVVHAVIAMAWDVSAIGARFSGAQWAGIGFALAAVALLNTARPRPPESAPGQDHAQVVGRHLDAGV